MKETLINLINKNNLIVISGKYGDLLTDIIVKSKKITGTNNIFLKSSDWQKKLFSSQQEWSKEQNLHHKSNQEKSTNLIFLDEIKLSKQRLFITFSDSGFFSSSRQGQLWIEVRGELTIHANRVEGNYLYCWIPTTNSPFNGKFSEKKIVILNDNSNRFLIQEINNRTNLKPVL